MVFSEMKPASSVVLGSVEDKFLVLTILGVLSVYDPASVLSSNKFELTGKLLVATDFVGVEVKNFLWPTRIVSVPLIGVVSGMVDRLTGIELGDLCCGDW